MAVDRLQGLLSRFSVSARLFHSGPLCGINDFADNGMGQLHLVRRGPLEVRHAATFGVEGREPSVDFPAVMRRIREVITVIEPANPITTVRPAKTIGVAATPESIRRR